MILALVTCSGTALITSLNLSKKVKRMKSNLQLDSRTAQSWCTPVVLGSVRHFYCCRGVVTSQLPAKSIGAALASKGGQNSASKLKTATNR